jgi:hypothetical protein
MIAATSSGAVVITDMERAKKLTNRPVKIAVFSS